jgi:hypothetical protein
MWHSSSASSPSAAQSLVCGQRCCSTGDQPAWSSFGSSAEEASRRSPDQRAPCCWPCPSSYPWTTSANQSRRHVALSSGAHNLRTLWGQLARSHLLLALAAVRSREGFRLFRLLFFWRLHEAAWSEARTRKFTRLQGLHTKSAPSCRVRQERKDRLLLASICFAHAGANLTQVVNRWRPVWPCGVQDNSQAGVTCARYSHSTQKLAM